MLRELGVPQDLLAELQAVPVLLVLVASLKQEAEETSHRPAELRCTNPQDDRGQ